MYYGIIRRIVKKKVYNMIHSSLNILRLTVRVAGIFYKMGDNMTLDRLLHMTEEEVRRLEGIGKKSVEDIKVSLAEQGLQLRVERRLDSVRDKYHRNALFWFLYKYNSKIYNISKFARVFKMSRTNADRIVSYNIRRSKWYEIDLLFVKK